MFNYPPLITKSRKNHFILQFQGITPCISCLFQNWEIMVWVHYKGDCWDGLCGFDASVRRSSKDQYYCALCFPEYRKYYSSRQELWVKHSFEPFLEWANETFVSTNYLCLSQYGGDGGSTSARIVTESELAVKTEHLETGNKNQDGFFCKMETILLTGILANTSLNKNHHANLQTRI